MIFITSQPCRQRIYPLLAKRRSLKFKKEVFCNEYLPQDR